MSMRINNLNLFNKNISFTSYNKLNSNTNMSVSTSFYHDNTTLEKAVETIETKFHSGCDILVYAGSNGEEAISIDSLLRNPEKYSIFSIDPYKPAIDYANNGLFAIHEFDDDGFLINENSKITEHEKYLKERFNKSFVQIEKPKNGLNNMTDLIYQISINGYDFQKYFQLRDNVKKRIKFIEENIENLSKFNSKQGKIGAIFFRNAIYQITQNDLNEILSHGKNPNIDLNKLNVIQKLIDEVDKKLEIGGIFVLGEHTQEHIFIADKYTSEESSYIYDKKRNIRLMAESPVLKAFEKNGNFKAIFYNDIKWPFNNASIKMPLIWQKTK